MSHVAHVITQTYSFSMLLPLELRYFTVMAFVKSWMLSVHCLKVFSLVRLPTLVFLFLHNMPPAAVVVYGLILAVGEI